ncbi:hypothetical protein [Brevibacillus formosus]
MCLSIGSQRWGDETDITHMLTEQAYVPEGYVALSIKETEIVIPFE